MGNSSIAAYGQLEEVAAALAGLRYEGQTDEFSGTDTIAIEVIDVGGLVASRTVNVEVEASSPPKIARMRRLASLPRNLHMDEDEQLSLDALEITVSNPTADSTVQVEIFCINGVVEIPSAKQATDLLTVTYTGAGMVVAGPTGVVNRALRLLVYSPDADIWGSDEISIVAREGRRGPGGGWNTVVSVENIIILIDPVNDTPIIDLPLALAGKGLPQAPGGKILALPGISVHDADAGEPAGSQLISVNVSTNGKGSMVSLAFGPTTVQGRIPGVRFIDGSAEGAYPRIVFNAPIAASNYALGLLQFWAPFGQPSGLDNITITVSDNGNWGRGIEEIVSVNVPIDVQYQQGPFAIGQGFVQWDIPPGALTMQEDGRLDVLGIALAADGGTDSSVSTWVEATVSAGHGLVQVVDKGGRRNTSTEVVRRGPKSMSISGAMADVSSTLADWTYVPEPNYHGVDVIELLAQGRNEEWTTNASVPVVVFSQPDPPVVTAADGRKGATVEVGGRITLQGVTIEHADAIYGDPTATLTLRAFSNAANSTIAMDDMQPGLWVYIDESAGGLVARGAVESLQLALDSGALKYVPLEGYDGVDVVTLSVSADKPFNDDPSRIFEVSSGDSNISTCELEVTVIPAYVPAAVTLEDGALLRTMEGSSVEMTGLRVNAPGRRNTSETVITVALATDQGGVTLPGAARTEVVAERRGESLVKVTGVETEVNKALIGAMFTGKSFYNGVASVQVIMFCT